MYTYLEQGSEQKLESSSGNFDDIVNSLLDSTNVIKSKGCIFCEPMQSLIIKETNHLYLQAHKSHVITFTYILYH